MKNTAVKVLGTTDEVTSCECCGKSDLNRSLDRPLVPEATVKAGADCAACRRAAEVVSNIKFGGAFYAAHLAAHLATYEAGRS